MMSGGGEVEGWFGCWLDGWIQDCWKEGKDEWKEKVKREENSHYVPIDWVIQITSRSKDETHLRMKENERVVNENKDGEW